MKKLKINFLPPQFTEKELLSILYLNNDVQEALRKLDVKMSSDLIKPLLLTSFTLKEAVESTRIEGTQTTISEVYEAHILTGNHDSGTNDTREVINYLEALERGKIMVERDGFIVGRTLKELHRLLLMGNVRGKDRSPGNFRTVNNWIGPENAPIEKATYIPPSHNEIAEYIKNLEIYINEGDKEFNKLPSIVRAAIIHAQFESIHPFLDGNGRVGRMLIPLYFQLKGDKSLSNLFVSSQLEKSKYQYYALLNGTRKVEPEWVAWIEYFLQSTMQSIEETSSKYDKVTELYKQHSESDDASYMKVLDVLFSHPILTVRIASNETGLSYPTVRRVLNQMVDRRIIFKDDKERNSKYFFYDLLRAVE